MTAILDPLEESLSFIRPRRLRVNVTRSMKHIIVLIVDADRASRSAKAAYYKSINLLAGSIVEALVHLLLKQSLKGTSTLPLGDWEYSEAKIIRKLNARNEIVWCRRTKSPQVLTRITTFKSVNTFCKDLLVIDQTLYDHCEKVRNMRNKIHLMGLSSIDGKYRKQDAEYALQVGLDLIKLLQSRSSAFSEA